MLLSPRFDERSRRLMVLASEEAARAGRSSVGSQDLFLAFLRAPDDLPGSTLSALGLDAERLRRSATWIRDLTVPEHETSAWGPDLKEALDGAIKRARSFRSNVVAPEHVLLGLLTDGSAVDLMLHAQGLSAAHVRHQLIARIGTARATD